MNIELVYHYLYVLLLCPYIYYILLNHDRVSVYHYYLTFIISFIFLKRNPPTKNLSIDNCISYACYILYFPLCIYISFYYETVNPRLYEIFKYLILILFSYHLHKLYLINFF